MQSATHIAKNSAFLLSLLVAYASAMSVPNHSWTHTSIIGAQNTPSTGLGLFDFIPSDDKLRYLVHAVFVNVTYQSMEIRGPVTNPSDITQTGPVVFSDSNVNLPVSGDLKLKSSDEDNIRNGKYYVQLNGKSSGNQNFAIRGPLLQQSASGQIRYFVSTITNTVSNPPADTKYSTGIAFVSLNSTGGYTSYVVHNMTKSAAATASTDSKTLFTMNQNMQGVFYSAGTLPSSDQTSIKNGNAKVTVVSGINPTTTLSGNLQELQSVPKTSGATTPMTFLSAMMIFLTIPFLMV